MSDHQPADLRDVPRNVFDPLVCAFACRRGEDIPHGKIEELVSLALERSGGKITPAVLKPIRKYFDQYMPLPTKTSDQVFKRLEASPNDPRSVSQENELALVGHLYRTIKQDFTVSLIMRFANPREFCIISQPIRKAARWMGIRIDEKRGDREYVALMRAMRKLRDTLRIERVADLDQGLYALYYQCLVGEGHRCTNYEALVHTKHESALKQLGETAKQAGSLRSLFDDARDRLEELDTSGQHAFLQRLMEAVADFGSEVIDALEAQKAQYFSKRARDIGRMRARISGQFTALTHMSVEAVELLAGAALLWEDQAQGANPIPGLIAVSCGQAFEHELRDVVFQRLGPAPTATGNAYTWLRENEPLLANHGEAGDIWRNAIANWVKRPKFETLIRMVATCADPKLSTSSLVNHFREALFKSFPALAGAVTPDVYGPTMLAADLDRLRELRNRCIHQANTGHKLAEQAASLVLGEKASVLASLTAIRPQ